MNILLHGSRRTNTYSIPVECSPRSGIAASFQLLVDTAKVSKVAVSFLTPTGHVWMRIPVAYFFQW